MSELCKKYNISEEDYKGLIKAGWISCSAPQYEKIYVFYRDCRSYQKTCDNFSISKSTLHEIIHKFE